MSHTESNRPSHIVWQVIDAKRQGEKSIFRRIGAIWPNRDGTGFNMALEAAPLVGRIAILPPREQEDQPAE